MAFDPLEYPGDAALRCDVMRPADASRVALQFTGTEVSPTMQRQITATFDADGRPRMLELLVPEPGRKPPRAHWLRVRFQPDAAGSHAVVDSGGGESFLTIIQSADAAARPLDGVGLARAQSFMDQLWARRCNFRVGQHQGRRPLPAGAPGHQLAG